VSGSLVGLDHHRPSGVDRIHRLGGAVASAEPAGEKTYDEGGAEESANREKDCSPTGLAALGTLAALGPDLTLGHAAAAFGTC
jgi:hypothetical protein